MPGAAGEPECHAGDTALLTIDLGALAANYRHLCDLAGAAECAAVVKADAYGLGMDEAAPALWRAGCRTFFVATLSEARSLRALLPDAVIYVFAGLMPGTAEAYLRHHLRPVLNSAAEIREWAAFGASIGQAFACAVHIDSGMNRLGLSADEVEDVAGTNDLWSALKLALVMSHLACASDVKSEFNATQLKRFVDAATLFPKAPRSLASTGGVLIGPDYHFDLVRPGIGLYGSGGLDADNPPLAATATVE
ncbi:MAG: alanine racemase, partial [Methyloceanibacter sp.]